MSFKEPYKLKKTGVEWLYEVPEHWSMQRVKDNTYLKGRVGWKGLSSDEYQPSGYAYLVTGTDFKGHYIDWGTCHWVDEERFKDDPFIHLQNGDLLITKDGTIGKLAIVSGLQAPACLNSGVFLMRPLAKAYSTEFMYWVLSSQAFSTFCDLSSFGSTIQHLYQNVFERFVFPVPPYDEQRSIANFLDRETGKIDALVAEQEKLIALLKEKRQAVISHAVTKGLDPSAPMKDSGVEWLGEVPAHWDVFRLRRLARSVQTGGTPTSFPPEEDIDEGVDWFTPGDFTGGIRLNHATKKVAEEAVRVGEVKLFPKGAVLIVGIGATLGKVGYLAQEASANQQINAVIPEDNIDGLCLTYSLSSKGAEMRFLSNASTIGIMNQEKTKEIWIALPPLSEQKRIVVHLDAEAVRVDALLSEAQRAIALLKEYRSALISSVVTGKVDVRGLVDMEITTEAPEAA